MPPRKKAEAKPAAYEPPKSTDGKPLPPIDPSVSAIVRKDDAVPVDLLQEYHRNPNKGDVDLIGTSLDENNLYRSICVNVGTLTGRPYEILAGNHTWKSVKAKGRTHIAVDWVDVDEQAAIKIVAVDNRAAEKGKRDVDVLAELLGDLDDLAGSGFVAEDLEKMLGTDLDTSPQLPDQGYAVLVDCDDETEQAELLARFEAEGLRARPLMM